MASDGSNPAADTLGSTTSTEGLSLLSYLQETFLSSPFNIILSFICAFLIYRLWKNSTPRDTDDYEVIKVPPPLEKHDMNLEELRKYDGRGPDGRVCIGINGFVYDCSKSHFYRPGGPYSSFAGRDATRGLAKFDVSAVSEEWDDHLDLTPSDISSLQEWEAQFRERYEIVGKLVKDLNKTEEEGEDDGDEEEAEDKEGARKRSSAEAKTNENVSSSNSTSRGNNVDSTSSEGKAEEGDKIGESKPKMN